MTIFSYRSNQSRNAGFMLKDQAEQSTYLIDFQDGVPSASVTISTATATALGSTGASATAVIVGTTSISGTQVTQITKTGGAGGTGAAINGDRFQITTQANLSNGEILSFNTYVYIVAPTYGP